VTRTTRTDDTGWFGFVDLAPGRYKAIVDGDAAFGRPATLRRSR